MFLDIAGVAGDDASFGSDFGFTVGSRVDFIVAGVVFFIFGHIDHSNSSRGTGLAIP